MFLEFNGQVKDCRIQRVDLDLIWDAGQGQFISPIRGGRKVPADFKSAHAEKDGRPQ